MTIYLKCFKERKFDEQFDESQIEYTFNFKMMKLMNLYLKFLYVLMDNQAQRYL